ncbi:hypothetical protein [Cellulomonas endophytica]|uniref:hypothetical protein n=1 Tax=Cellulomonas endophytica TaxID=2494735 RepID=UPI001012F84D|nr:hypothetical protein [Cellulomonas endophytica]
MPGWPYWVVVVPLAAARVVRHGVVGLQVVLVVGILIGLLVLGWWLGARRRVASLRSLVRRHRPGWDAEGVFLGAVAGPTASPEVRASACGVLAFGLGGVDLLARRRDPLVLGAAWSAVDRVDVATVSLGQGQSLPGVRLVLSDGRTAEVVPMRDRRGGVLPASAADVALLAAELEALRRAATARASAGPRSSCVSAATPTPRPGAGAGVAARGSCGSDAGDELLRLRALGG